MTNPLLLPATVPVGNPFTEPTVAGLLSATAAGHLAAAGFISTLVGSIPPVVALYPDQSGVGGCDDRTADCALVGPGASTPLFPAGFFSSAGPLSAGGSLFGLAEVLTDQQEALLGCGPFFRDPARDASIPGTFATEPGPGPYSASCDVYGIDLFHTEASVLFQAWPGFQKDGPVATRYWNGSLVTLPGARGPALPSGAPNFAYDPRVDGCIGDLGLLGFGPALEAQLDPNGVCNGRPLLRDPRTLDPFTNELAIVSYNALLFIMALDLQNGPSPLCTGFPSLALPDEGIGCPTLQDFFSVTQVARPDLRAGGNGRFGRRDFAWAGAGEIILEYEKVNTLGLAMDFSEDHTATNWGVELSWTASKDFVNSEVPSLRSESDLFALTVSVDRPSFVHFLNRERTFFFNMQWFFEYIPDHVGKGDRDSYRGYAVDGPWTALGVFTLETGYFQDRLTPSATFVYDVRSESGAVALDMRYRFTAQFSVTIGMNHFYGPGDSYVLPIGLGALGESNQTHKTERYSRLNAIRERDELFLLLRYTF
jgi:hypothetical protein